MKRLKPLVVFAFVLLALLIASISVFADASDERYGVGTLTEKERHIYAKLVEGINKDSPDAKVTLDNGDMGLTVEELYSAYSAFVHDYPECFWITTGYNYTLKGSAIVSVQPQYSFSASEIPEAKARLDAVVNEILSGMVGESIFERALYLHDAVAKRVEYRHVGHHQTAYGALVDGEAVCAGYAAAYQLLLQRAGIEAYTVTGYSYDPSSGDYIAHAWNLVMIDDGVCVYTDVTWDDQGDSLYRYYFNLSYAEISADHFENKDFFIAPECSHTESSYFDVRGGIVTDDSTPDDVAAFFSEARDGVRTAQILYEGDFEAWMAEHSEELYAALGGGVGSYGYSMSFLGNEYHISMNGNFPRTSYFLDVVAPQGMSTQDNPNQAVEEGGTIEEIIYTASDAYYFPTDYSVESPSGITVEVLDLRRIKISGTLSADARLELAPPTAKEKPETPVDVSALENSTDGVILGVDDTMEYKIEGGEWTAITASELTGLKSGVYYVRYRATETELASDAVKITVKVLCVHANVQDMPAQSANCKHDGNEAYKLCVDCGEVTEGSNAAIKGDHTYGEWVTVRKSSFGVDGERERSCTLCGHEEKENIPAETLSETLMRLVQENTKVVYAAVAVLLLLILVRIIFKRK